MKDRIFTTKDSSNNDWVLKFKRPTQSQINKAELIYRKKFSDAVRNDVLLRDEAIKIVKRRGLYDSEEEKKELDLRVKIASLEDSLSDIKDYSKGKTVCDEISKLRTELMDHSSVVTSIMENTCEAIANSERNQYFVVQCIYDDNTDQRVYKDIDDFKSKVNERASLDAYQETLIANLESRMGKELPSDLTKEFAENVWLSSNTKKDEKKKKKKSKTK